MFTLFSLKTIARLLLVVSIISLACVAYSWYYSLNRAQEWLKAQATVTELEWEGSEDTRHAYAQFSFTAADGKEYTTRSTVAGNPPLYKVGDTQLLLYPPHAPQKAMEATFFAQFAVPLALSAEALFCCIATLLLYFFVHRAKKTANLPPPPQV